ncbi:MAG TPA: hypothetical protein VMM76_27960 [Pirellulaceae bacterium]|nr:hypothetical protein [Pirellulaceae bacterium]
MTSKNGNAVGKVIQRLNCAVYTRKSSEDGLEQEFNSLDAQREAGEAYIKSQASEGWECQFACLRASPIRRAQSANACNAGTATI